MKRISRSRFCAFVASLVFVVHGEIAHGDIFNMSPGLVPLQFATVDDAGNADDLHLNGLSLGSVDYAYRLGQFEITAAQYTEFLNAVAADDTYSLYDPLMSDLSFKGCNIQRSGSPGNYTYSVPSDWANRPVNMVTFWDAARFVNWLHNGQLTGAQGPATTEGGAYHHVGVQQLFGRNPDAKYFIPTEDEWYKAAYHKGGGLTGNYWNYPTSSNDEPANTFPDRGNNANYAGGCCSGANIPAIGAPYYRSEVGAYTNSESPYGTFDQGGNVWEWNESVFQAQYRGLRGGSFAAYADSMQGTVQYYNDPLLYNQEIGFRVAAVIPEPSALLLAAIVALPSMVRRIGRRKLGAEASG